MEVSVIYLIVINVTTMVIFGWDKLQARSGGRRIRERDLLLLAIFGGSLGGLLAMYLFRHKTRHLKFQIGMPLILILQLIITALLNK
ncbi:MAG: DUF1294 domain-containing protein [Acidobacteriota bacterium]